MSFKTKLTFLVLLLSFVNLYGQFGFQEQPIENNDESLQSMRHFFNSDMDNDGDTDILVAGKSKLVWIKNLNGTGEFGQPKFINDSYEQYNDVIAADLDGDSDEDVIFLALYPDPNGNSNSCNGYISVLSWLRNENGQGLFSEEILIDTLHSNTCDLTQIDVADFDGNGSIDILYSMEGSVYLIENLDGLGNFDSNLRKYVTSYDNNAASKFVDFDGDNDLDIFTISDNNIVWYQNLDGQGTLGIVNTIATVGVGSRFSIVDLDNDGDLDIVEMGWKLWWYENLNGQGDFGAAIEIDQDWIDYDAIYCDDMDNDGDIDIIVARNDDFVWYEHLNGSTNFSDPQLITQFTKGNNEIIATDLDNDGDLDIIAASGKNLRWHENQGQGSFSEYIDIIQPYTSPTSTSLVDIDNDGDLDVVYFTQIEIYWRENLNGLGDFGPQILIGNSVYSIQSMDVKNLDADGDVDVLFTSLKYSTFNTEYTGWIEHLDGLGDFGEATLLSTSYGVTEYAKIADVDGDNLNDVIGLNPLIWFKNLDGIGNFGSKQTIDSGNSGENHFYPADVDADGDLDIVWIDDSFTFILKWFENVDGLGDFTPGGATIDFLDEDISFVNNIIAFSADGEEDLDIAIIVDRMVYFYKNLDGLGTFSSAPDTLENFFLTPVFLDNVDLDNDGDQDLLIGSQANNGPSRYSWLENVDGAGTFSAEQILIDSIPGEIRSSDFGDIDNDGDIDIASVQYYSNPSTQETIWYENLGRLSKVHGKVSVDLGSGCDFTNSCASNVKLKLDDGSNTTCTFTTEDGRYHFFENEGTYDIGVANLNYFTADPVSHTAMFSDSATTHISNFCLIPTQTINDLRITILPLTNARAGFDAEYRLLFRNIGSTLSSGTFHLSFDDTKMTYVVGTEPNISQTNNLITFEFSDLLPFETRSVDVIFKLSPPPVNNLNEFLVLEATIEPDSPDDFIDNNNFVFEHLVIGSYDPNDIRVLEGESIFLSEIDDYLHYIIRFQNTGTADAINVRVENILDTKLDWETFELETYSHSNRSEILDGNQVNFIFDNIHLPDSTSNEPESHGFIAYRIKPKQNIQVGDIISSTANIFFDFNPPIVTNTAMTEVIDPISINEIDSFEFSIYPNPTSGKIEIITKKLIENIEIFDISGQMVLSRTNQSSIDLSSLEHGVYFCKFITQSGKTGVKKIKFVK